MDDLRQTIESANQRAIAFHQQGEKPEAADAAVEAYEQAREHLAPDDPLRRRITMNAAAIAELAGHDENALFLYAEAVDVADALGDVATLGQSLDRLFAIHRRRDEHDAAALAGERSLALWRGRHEPMNDTVLSFMNDLAQTHYRAGAVGAAATLIEEVIGQRRRLSSADTPALALALLNLGTARKSQGDLVSAESHLLSALAMRRRLLPPGDAAIADALEHLSGLYASQKDYGRAIPYEEEMLALARCRESEPLSLARALTNVATLYYLAGEVARSRPLYEESLAIVTRIRGKQHADTAVVMGNLANVLRRLADFDAGERLLRDVVATRRALLGDLHELVAVAIDDLTDLFGEKRSASDVERFYRDVLGIVLRHVDDPAASTSRLLESLQKMERMHETLAPDRPRSLARVEAERLRPLPLPNVQVLANLMYALKEYAFAATLFTEASAQAPRRTHAWSLATVGLAASFASADDLLQAERVCDDYIATVHAGWQGPADHYARMLRIKSQVQEITHGPAAAITALQESIAQSERSTAESSSVWLTDSLLSLSELHLAAGDFEAAGHVAGSLLEKPPAILEAATAARARVVLARVASHENRLVEAESLFRAALPPMTAEPTWRAALALRDYGLLLVGASDAASGVSLLQRAVAMAKDLDGDRSSAYAAMLATLAEARTALGLLFDAAPMFVEVASIANEAGSPELLARALRGSGALYTRMGASDAAEDLLTQALTAMARHDASPVELASVETDLAMTEMRLDQCDAALERIERTLATLQAMAPGSASFVNATRAKMWILGRLQRWHEAFDAARVTSDGLEESLRQPLAIASASGRDQFAGALYRQLDIVLSLAVRLHTPLAIADACERTFRWKGAALTWSASQVQALASSADVEIRSLRRDYIDVRREIIRRSISGPGIGASPTVEDLQRREEALDRTIGRQLSLASGYGTTSAPTPVDLKTVAAALPAGSALIDYVRYESIAFERGDARSRFDRGTYRYAAFVLRPDAEPALIDLGEADAIDRGVSRFRSAITGEADPGGFLPSAGAWVDGRAGPRAPVDPPAFDGDWIVAGTDLRRQVFDPLIDAIGSCSRLCIAQHGELTRLPFAALPIGYEFLIDRYELTSLDTGRDLLRSAGNGTPQESPLVMADPDFDLELQTLSDDDRLRPFESLSGTREEGVAVAAILGVVPDMGAGAVESRMRTARSPRVLHIATHGFFLTDDRPPRPDNVFETVTMVEIPGYGTHMTQAIEKPREIDEGPVVDRLTRMGRLPDPLLRSGVALAGSNAWASGGSLSGGDDGLMTAAEIALLDFTSTELAVLSACETGLGEVRRGEGIFGLRRAFSIAGAGTLVMSLWKLPDLETRDLMIEFYRRVAAEETFAAALRAAQRHVRETSPHPQAWAGLLCIGKPAA